MTPAIRIQNLSKLYRIGARRDRSYSTLRETIVEGMARPLRRLRGIAAAAAQPHTPFLALRDVSLDVQRGEVIGVIGANGAGKSTLLRILSGITEPTEGRVELRGRVASLLEIGTGFHFELTGRENIYLNGAVLGMTRREIARRFDEIVAFADIGDFLDTPVKRYSSGMHVRLGFAVACHLEPEILLVDEVLAVGDESFQRKCLGKLDEVSRSGRTVLFVSHNMPAVLNLCQRAAVLNHGRLEYLGDSKSAVDHYLNQQREPGAGEVDLSAHANRRPGCTPILNRIRLLDDAERPQRQLRCGEPFTIELTVNPRRCAPRLHFDVVIEDATRCRLFTLSTELSNCGGAMAVGDGTSRVTCRVDQLPLAPGRYCASVYASLPRERPLDAVDRAAWFEVVPTDFYGNGRPPDAERGPLVMRSDWAVEQSCQPESAEVIA